MMTGCIRSLSVSGVLCLLFAAGAAQAQVTQVADRASLNANDIVEWGSLQTQGILTPLPNPFTHNSQRGLNLSVTHPDAPSSSFSTDDTSIWGGNFTAGDDLVYTAQNRGAWTITFAYPVFAVGTQFNSIQFESFTASMEAFDEGGNSLGVFTRQGVTANTYDNTAPFVGISSETAEIKSLRLSISTPNGFAINQMTVRSGVVPAPSSVAAFILGAVPGAAMLLRRRRKA
jgi:hypothetical protein